MERVALAHVVNDEIRRVADRFDLRANQHAVGWLCGCGCSELVNATLAEYDARGGRVFATGHPIESRVAATAEFERQRESAAVIEHLDEELRRKLTDDLGRRLERQALARRLQRVLRNDGES
ncbi:MAG: hypothetical protein ACTHNB_10325 [Gaiellaceae bacterium]